jgi:hypothetical protein
MAIASSAFLPEANLFSAFLKAGIGVYAMELKRPTIELELADITLERLIDDIDDFSEIAFEHQNRRFGWPSPPAKLVFEGYCGLGVPTLAYLAARPEQAERKTAVAMLMVAPIDAPACDLVGDLVAAVPSAVAEAHFWLSHKRHGAVSGGHLRKSMDLSIGSYGFKTPFARFVSGFRRPVFAYLESSDELDESERFELAAAYWLSEKNAHNWPVPVDLVHFFLRLFRQGLHSDLVLPAKYRGKPICLERIVKETSIQLCGFYGGRDEVVPDSTAGVLIQSFGDRYTHVVHPKAGHISYVMTRTGWHPGSRNAFTPNPIQVISELYQRS